MRCMNDISAGAPPARLSAPLMQHLGRRLRSEAEAELSRLGSSLLGRLLRLTVIGAVCLIVLALSPVVFGWLVELIHRLFIDPKM